MLNIVIIGTGNVSHHLCRTIENSKVLNLLQLFGRIEKLPENFNQKIVYTNNLEELKKADFYIICVSDDAILEISDKLIFKDSIIVHTSGSTRWIFCLNIKIMVYFILCKLLARIKSCLLKYSYYNRSQFKKSFK
jgi:aspartate-semialdehyde dehydrogenase